MITGIAIKNQTKNTVSSVATWQKSLANAIRDPLALVRLLDLPPHPTLSAEAASQFSVLVPHHYLQQMEKGNWQDPLLRQVLPLEDELKPVAGFGIDPVGDHAAMQSDGVLHKYQGRVLLITTGACAIHCRYCFRRHFPYPEALAARDHWQAALNYIRDHTDVEEVILSGGDPLVLADTRLLHLCQSLAAIRHVKRIRFHTRLPVVLPERIDKNFLAMIQRLPIQLIVVLHANHANELLNAAVAQALNALRKAGVLLLNQAVLLRGVNDSVAALRQLSEALIQHAVVPYYLHLLDRVAGAAHFEVPVAEAQRLLHTLRQQVPGYFVPELVWEEAGKASKTPVPTHL